MVLAIFLQFSPEVFKICYHFLNKIPLVLIPIK